MPLAHCIVLHSGSSKAARVRVIVEVLIGLLLIR